MEQGAEPISFTNPRIRSHSNLQFFVSCTIAVLMLAASLSGLLKPDELYPSGELLKFALANDLANLIIGLPILLGCMWLAWRGNFIGKLLWPGALMYTLYNYLAYVIAVPFSWTYLSYLAIVSTSMYALVSVTSSIDAESAKRRLAGKVPERLSGGVLILLGGFVFVRVFGVVADAVSDSAVVPLTDRALLLADVLLAPAWIIGGALLWRKQPPGYAFGLGLLFQGSMLFIGLILVLALQPVFSSVTFPWTDILVVAVMGFICFIPFALYIRGSAASRPDLG